jgi:hypothetical protein
MTLQDLTQSVSSLRGALTALRILLRMGRVPDKQLRFQNGPAIDGATHARYDNPSDTMTVRFIETEPGFGRFGGF